ncbi:hypothetical protein ACHHYP_02285 [Achlya hypogyna]|uniref:FYVE-type domain-containing protein n=1 Tax=Achlya hypogyna TaxID=1202772 RepID=A0A1V9Z718_ACHHY|nr:hypothetical protein ACHHYP_02285 [Achlya hypogyna]
MRESLSWGGVDTATWCRLSCADHHEDLGATSSCRGCRGGFNYFSRKHHCHLCGLVMCASCLADVEIDKEDTRRSSMYGFRATALSTMRSQGMPGQHLQARLCVDCCAQYVQQHNFVEVAKCVTLKASYTVADTKPAYDGRADTFDSTVSMPRCSSVRYSLGSEEERRLNALRTLQVLDSEPEQVLDVMSAIAGATYDCPMAGISFIDDDREWFKSAVGFPGWDLPRRQSLAAQTVRWKQPVAFCSKAAIQKRFRAHPWLKGPLHVQFYAAAPLTTAAGHVVGAVFVMDTRPRRAFDAAGLLELAASVLARLEAVDDELTELNSSVMMQSVLSVISSARSQLSSVRSVASTVEVPENELHRSSDDGDRQRRGPEAEMERMLAALLASQAQTQAILDDHRTTYLSHVA